MCVMCHADDYGRIGKAKKGAPMRRPTPAAGISAKIRAESTNGASVMEAFSQSMRCFEFYRAESLTQASCCHDGFTRSFPAKSVLTATGFFGLPPLGHTFPNASVLNTKKLNIYLNIKAIKAHFTLSNPIIRLHEVCINQGLTPNFRVISLLFLRAECGSTCCGILHSD